MRLEGIAPWDGDYPIDLSYFTNRELHEIKKIADVRAGELEDEFRRGNNDLVVAVAAIAARRNGKDIPLNDLWDAAAGRIDLVLDDEPEADDAGPPESPTPTVPEGSGVESVQPVPSGSSSSEPLDDQQETNLASTGSLQ